MIHLTWSPGVKSKQTLADDNRSVSVITSLKIHGNPWSQVSIITSLKIYGNPWSQVCVITSIMTHGNPCHRSVLLKVL